MFRSPLVWPPLITNYEFCSQLRGHKTRKILYRRYAPAIGVKSLKKHRSAGVIMDLKIIVMFTLRTYLSRVSERESLPIHPQDFSVFVLNLTFFRIDVEYFFMAGCVRCGLY